MYGYEKLTWHEQNLNLESRCRQLRDHLQGLPDLPAIPPCHHIAGADASNEEALRKVFWDLARMAVDESRPLRRELACDLFHDAMPLAFYKGQATAAWLRVFPDIRALRTFRLLVGLFSWPDQMAQSPWDDAYTAAARIVKKDADEMTNEAVGAFRETGLARQVVAKLEEAYREVENSKNPTA